MLERLRDIINLIGNMGPRYLAFRSMFELKKRTGFLEKQFPSDPPFKTYFHLEQWKHEGGKFFFSSAQELGFPRELDETLLDRFRQYQNGKILMFNSFYHDFGKETDWFVNPDNGYRYPERHWTKIDDYSSESGDIKYVWEKARFSFVLDLIRYDYHYQTDCSSMIFSEIMSWIKANPVNIGPHYRCSQEMSIRLMNWFFCLYYYKNSKSLTEEVFAQIQYSIYWHLHHIYHNIHFSRIAVRNNHALTETLALYVSGLLFPFVPEFREWSRKGKAWFEEEVAYQIYEDGTFLQFSMNYHRVAVQLLTWGLKLSELNGSVFNNTVYQRAEASLRFLQSCTNNETGFLPNYGANDGALFFRLNNSPFRDYRSCLNALSFVLKKPFAFEGMNEDACWYGLDPDTVVKVIHVETGMFYFPQGGYVIIREQGHLTFLRCGTHRDRPSQADNLHLDCWEGNFNVLQDGGTYKYNTDVDTLKYFMGTESHNTVMLDRLDQMKKGSRFIWYYWTTCNSVSIQENDDSYTVTARISAFRYVNRDLTHTRTVVKYKGISRWYVNDQIEAKPTSMRVRQLWHMPLNLAERLSIIARSGREGDLQPISRNSFVSPLYGVKESSIQTEFSTYHSDIETTIQIH